MEVESSDAALATRVGVLTLSTSDGQSPSIRSPVVGNLSVSNRSTVHLGHRVYNVTQHVTHKEVVRGERLENIVYYGTVLYCLYLVPTIENTALSYIALASFVISLTRYVQRHCTWLLSENNKKWATVHEIESGSRPNVV